METATLLYEVAFFTYGKPDPGRLGTAEKMIGRLRLWAKNADDAIKLARSVAVKQRMEYLGTVSADAITGVILEQIVNDPLNGYDFSDEPSITEEANSIILT